MIWPPEGRQRNVECGIFLGTAPTFQIRSLQKLIPTKFKHIGRAERKNRVDWLKTVGGGAVQFLAVILKTVKCAYLALGRSKVNDTCIFF